MDGKLDEVVAKLGELNEHVTGARSPKDGLNHRVLVLEEDRDSRVEIRREGRSVLWTAFAAGMIGAGGFFWSLVTGHR